MSDPEFGRYLRAWRHQYRELLIAKAEALALTRPFRPPRPFKKLTADEIRAAADAWEDPRPFAAQARQPARLRVRRGR